MILRLYSASENSRNLRRTAQWTQWELQDITCSLTHTLTHAHTPFDPSVMILHSPVLYLNKKVTKSFRPNRKWRARRSDDSDRRLSFVVVDSLNERTIPADAVVHDIATGEASGRSSEDGQVVAALGAHFDRHALVVARHQSVQEAPGLLGEALFALVGGASAPDGLGVVSPEADLADHALEQLGHVVLQRRRRLDELAVEHHRARSALWVKKVAHWSQ